MKSRAAARRERGRASTGPGGASTLTRAPGTWAPGAPPDGRGVVELPHGTKDQKPKDQEAMAQLT